MTSDDYLPSQVNACLLPVVGGVGIASAADLNFTWDCFAFAMGSNLAFSLRGVLSKKLSKKTDKGENMDDPGNAFAVMTAFAFLAVLPIALAIEGPSMATEWDKAMAKGVSTAGPAFSCMCSPRRYLNELWPSIAGPALHAGAHHGAIPSPQVSAQDLLFRLVASGLSFYLYNEVSFYVLDSVHPITHAVGNTIKRVILILYSVVRFGSVLSLQASLVNCV
jgi:solute carrier family 35 protein E1